MFVPILISIIAYCRAADIGPNHKNSVIKSSDSRVQATATPAEWIVAFYYADNRCDEYVGESGTAANVCLSSNDGSGLEYILNTYVDNGSYYDITESHYSDAACTIHLFDTLFNPPTTCGSSGGGYGFVKVVSTLPTSFLTAGAYFALYPSGEECITFSPVGTIFYLFLAFGGICLPAFNGDYMEAVARDAYKIGSRFSCPLTQTTQSFTQPTCTDYVSTTSGSLLGYANYYQQSESDGALSSTTIIIIVVVVVGGAVVAIAAVAVWYLLFRTKSNMLMHNDTKSSSA